MWRSVEKGKVELMRAIQKKLIIALAIGCALGFIHNTIPGDGTAVLQVSLYYIVLFPLAVLIISRPFSSYLQSIATAVVAILGWTGVKLTTEVLTQPDFKTVQWMWLFWGFYGTLGLVANVIMVSLVTFLRLRFYPIYPSGQCQECGIEVERP